MNVTAAIETARREMENTFQADRASMAAGPNSTAAYKRYVWQRPENQKNWKPGSQKLPEQHDPYAVLNYGPGDPRPYYVVSVTGRVEEGLAKFEHSVEIFNRPDYARATIWDRIAAAE